VTGDEKLCVSNSRKAEGQCSNKACRNQMSQWVGNELLEQVLGQ